MNRPALSARKQIPSHSNKFPAANSNPSSHAIRAKTQFQYPHSLAKQISMAELESVYLSYFQIAFYRHHHSYPSMTMAPRFSGSGETIINCARPTCLILPIAIWCSHPSLNATPPPPPPSFFFGRWPRLLVVFPFGLAGFDYAM